MIRAFLFAFTALSLLGLSFCNPCGSDSSSIRILGIQKMYTHIAPIYGLYAGNSIDSFGISLNCDFRTAFHHSPTFLTSAVACSPLETYPRSIERSWLDSVIVTSMPVYVPGKKMEELLFLRQKVETIGDYNTGIINNLELGNLLLLKEAPAASDSFTFGFYYYKNGVIIDSSFTQKHFIRQ